MTDFQPEAHQFVIRPTNFFLGRDANDDLDLPRADQWSLTPKWVTDGTLQAAGVEGRAARGDQRRGRECLPLGICRPVGRHR